MSSFSISAWHKDIFHSQMCAPMIQIFTIEFENQTIFSSRHLVTLFVKMYIWYPDQDVYMISRSRCLYDIQIKMYIWYPDQDVRVYWDVHNDFFIGGVILLTSPSVPLLMQSQSKWDRRWGVQTSSWRAEDQ